MKIVEKNPSDLTPYKHNARTHEPLQVKQIIRSIEDFGFTNPVLIDEKGGIIAGHGRVEAAIRMELKKIPTITLEGLSEEQKRAYIIADNKIALNSGWDEDMLIGELQALEEGTFDLEASGFTLDEFDALQLAQLADSEVVDGAVSSSDAPTNGTGQTDGSVMFSAPVSDEQYNNILDAITLCKTQHEVNHTGAALSIICKEWTK